MQAANDNVDSAIAPGSVSGASVAHRLLTAVSKAWSSSTSETELRFANLEAEKIKRRLESEKNLHDKLGADGMDNPATLPILASAQWFI